MSTLNSQHVAELRQFLLECMNFLADNPLFADDGYYFGDTPSKPAPRGLCNTTHETSLQMGKPEIDGHDVEYMADALLQYLFQPQRRWSGFWWSPRDKNEHNERLLALAFAREWVRTEEWCYPESMEEVEEARMHEQMYEWYSITEEEFNELSCVAQHRLIDRYNEATREA